MKKVKNKCKHKETKFIGVRIAKKKGKYLYIFKCNSCLSSISIPTEKLDIEFKP